MDNGVEFKVSEKFTKQRIKEVESHETLGTPELDALWPLLKEIIEGKARGYVIGVEYKDGVKMVHKYRASCDLVDMICKDKACQREREAVRSKVKEWMKEEG